jgi:hypothetical protein
MAQRVATIKPEGPLPGDQGAVSCDLGTVSGFLGPNIHKSARIKGMGAGKARIDFDCSPKHVVGRHSVVAAGSIERGFFTVDSVAAVEAVYLRRAMNSVYLGCGDQRHAPLTANSS